MRAQRVDKVEAIFVQGMIDRLWQIDRLEKELRSEKKMLYRKLDKAGISRLDSTDKTHRAWREVIYKVGPILSGKN